MKLLLRLLLLAMMGSAYAQSNLPACQGGAERNSNYVSTDKWHNCFGTWKDPGKNATYVGEWRNGKQNGQGKMSSFIWEYTGEWKNGKENGQGTFTRGSEKYIGGFKDGNFSGQGILYDKFSGKVLKEGLWANGKFQQAAESDLELATRLNHEEKLNQHRLNMRKNIEKRMGGSNQDLVRPSAEPIIIKGEEARIKQREAEEEQIAQAAQASRDRLAAYAEETKRQQREAEKGASLQIQARRDRLAAEAEEAKRKQPEADNQQRLQAQQATQRQRELKEQSKLTKLDTQPINATKVASNVFANRRALVIGNDSYKSVTKLENAREDAKTVASNLMSVGYQVTLKTDLNEKEMKSALRTFASQVQGGDEVMFFFAGHGVQLGAANYLLPIDILGDSEAQVKDEAIQLQRILDDMSEKKAKFTLVMIDACRDNPFKSSGRAIGGRGLAPTTAATGQMVIFSAGTGQQALDKLNNADKNKNGLFTRVFVQEMQKPNQSIDRVVKNVRNQVAELAKSVGHEQVPAVYDQVLGDFYFRK